jgi:hypothetical protein
MMVPPEIIVGAIALGALILVAVGVRVIDRIGERRP